VNTTDVNAIVAAKTFNVFIVVPSAV